MDRLSPLGVAIESPRYKIDMTSGDRYKQRDDSTSIRLGQSEWP